MKASYQTKLGKIEIDNNVIAKIAGLSAIECFGIVGMASISKKDGIVQLLTRNSITKGVRVYVDENEVTIDLHIIVAYGVQIATVTANLVDAVKYQVENATGFSVNKINIVVEGVRVID